MNTLMQHLEQAGYQARSVPMERLGELQAALAGLCAQ